MVKLLEMRKKMENINVFNYSKLKLMNEKPSKIISWITILSIIIVLFIIFSVFFKYHLYSSHVGYIDNNYNLIIIVNNNSFPIKKNYKLYIDNKKYKYKIKNINKQKGYYEILIECKLDDDLLIKNNIITITLKKEQTTLMKELIKKLKKGLI